MPTKRSIEFDPVPLRPRHDGWTPERQFAFIEKLAACGSAVAACAAVGMSRESARRLRRRFPVFRDAWDAAVDCSYGEVEESAMERSMNGVARPIFYRGEQVGEWRHHDERLTMFLLRFRRRHRFGAEADKLPRKADRPPGCGNDGEPDPFDPEGQLDGQLMALEFAPPPPNGGDDEYGIEDAA